MKGGRGRISDFPGQSGDNPSMVRIRLRWPNELNAYADLGISHVQLVIDPINASQSPTWRRCLDILDA